MYLPPLFRSDDLALTRRIADESPLATWVCAMPDGSLEIAHLPSLWHEHEGQIVVRAHVARANRLGVLATQQARATVLFHGPHAYVSPSWYEHPDEQVPTWNYVVVHASGGCGRSMPVRCSRTSVPWRRASRATRGGLRPCSAMTFSSTSPAV